MGSFTLTSGWCLLRMFSISLFKRVLPISVSCSAGILPALQEGANYAARMVPRAAGLRAPAFRQHALKS